MKIYLSGPISNQPDGNRLEFSLAERHLKSQGHTVVNPHHIANDGTWNHAMRADIKAMMDCDAIYVIKGWELSKGSCLEVYLALKLSMQIINGGPNGDENC